MQNSAPVRKSRPLAVSDEPDDFTSAMARLGALPPLAAALGLPESTIYAWRRRNSIPVGYWELVEQYARSIGVRSVTFNRFRRYESTRVTAELAGRNTSEQLSSLPFASKS